MTHLRLACCAVLVAATMLIPAQATAGPPQASAARACGTLKLSVGKSIVRASGVGCSTARRFVKAYLNRDCGETRDCNFTRIRFGGYRCVQHETTKLTKNTCVRGRKKISELHA